MLNQIMKSMKKMALIAALAFAPAFLSQADELWKLSWRGTVYTNGSAGQIVARSFTEKDFINAAAVDNSLDPKSLAFVYRPLKHDTAIVSVLDGHFVADVIQMENNFTEVPNPTQTQIIRQAFLYDEAHGLNSPLGSAFGTETIKRDLNGNFTSYRFKGTMQYHIDSALYSGTFSTGSKIKDTSTP
jgi:hypothetical protein